MLQQLFVGPPGELLICAVLLGKVRHMLENHLIPLIYLHMKVQIVGDADAAGHVLLGQEPMDAWGTGGVIRHQSAAEADDVVEPLPQLPTDGLRAQISAARGQHDLHALSLGLTQGVQ